MGRVGRKQSHIKIEFIALLLPVVKQQLFLYVSLGYLQYIFICTVYFSIGDTQNVAPEPNILQYY